MSDPNSRPLRKVGIADHLWQTYEDMARQMGADRDALINQALFTFARANGFIEVASGAPRPAASAAAPELAPTPAPVRGGGPMPARTAPAPARVVEDTRSDVGARPSGASASAEKALDTAAQLDRLIKGKDSVTDETYDDEESEPRQPPPRAPGRGAPTAPPLAEDEAPALYVMFEDGDPEKVVGQTALIGRGRHCEFVIDSGKVSREHARIVREADGYYLEDLGSSNGTWFNKQRIKRRKIEDGDEFYICSEKVRFVLR